MHKPQEMAYRMVVASFFFSTLQKKSLMPQPGKSISGKL
jgi:hypothetical protein